MKSFKVGDHVRILACVESSIIGKEAILEDGPHPGSDAAGRDAMVWISNLPRINSFNPNNYAFAAYEMEPIIKPPQLEHHEEREQLPPGLSWLPEFKPELEHT